MNSLGIVPVPAWLSTAVVLSFKIPYLTCTCVYVYVYLYVRYVHVLMQFASTRIPTHH
jgi:hypothetical protein